MKDQGRWVTGLPGLSAPSIQFKVICMLGRVTEVSVDGLA